MGKQKRSKVRKEKERLAHANAYKEGYDHGYIMGLKVGREKGINDSIDHIKNVASNSK